jgi:RNA polymerase primary sigma factor
MPITTNTSPVTTPSAPPSSPPARLSWPRRNGRRAPQGARLPSDAERAVVLAAKHGGQREREELIELFTPSIAGIARMYRRSTTVDWNELMQEGVLGLLWVRQAMQQLVSELSGPVVLSDRALRQLARIKNAQREYQQTVGREPSPADLARKTGMPRCQVESLMAAERTPRGLQEPAGGEDRGATVGELIADPTAEDAYETAPLRVAVSKLPPMFAPLSSRERKIIRARYGLDGEERTLGELASDMGVSAERVRQIEQASLEKMRAACEYVRETPLHAGRA